uniref:EF-hand domain-containing protein n=1 Tax=Kalanchoe fedtschenkoi TaxID=63787 RepID=A0A7N0SY95_KALFE
MSGDALTHDQISDFYEAFCLIDKDSDGYITLEELARVIESMDERSKKDDAQTIISELIEKNGAENGNQPIGFPQFLNIMAKKTKEIAVDELQEAFKVFDRDQDGYISAFELRNVMINLGERLSLEEAEQMIREADQDGDGLVSYEEFALMMTTF